MKKLTALALALVLILSLASPAFAANITSKEAKITYRGINVRVDGELLVPIDGDGNRIEPFIMNDSTYMPLRAVASAFGLGVDWDDATSTAVLTTGGTPNLGKGTPLSTKTTVTKTIYFRGIRITIDGKEIIPLDFEGKRVEPFIMDGTTYLPVRAMADALGKDVSWEDATSTAWLGGQPAQTFWQEASVTEKDETGKVTCITTNEYDKNGVLTKYSKVYPLEPTSSFSSVLSYDANGQLASETYSYGAKETYTYDAQGNCVKDVLSTFLGDLEHTMTYDAQGNCLTETILVGGSTTTFAYTYNDRGDPVKVVSTNPDGTVDTVNNSYVYGAYGWTESTLLYSGADGAMTKYYTREYDANGNVVSEKDYDVTGGTKQLADTTVFTYDANGCLSSVVSGAGSVEYTYKEFTV